MDAFSASLMADKREIVFAPTVYKFQTFAQMAEEFNLGERDVVLTNEFIYTPFMKELGLKCNFVFQEKFGAGEPSEAMIETMYEAIPYDSYDRVIAVGEYARGIADAAHESAEWYPDAESAVDAARAAFTEGSVLLCKASHSMHLEKIVEELLKTT